MVTSKTVLLEILSSKSGRVLYEQKNQKNMAQLMTEILEDDEWKGI